MAPKKVQETPPSPLYDDKSVQFPDKAFEVLLFAHSTLDKPKAKPKAHFEALNAIKTLADHGADFLVPYLITTSLVKVINLVPSSAAMTSTIEQVGLSIINRCPAFSVKVIIPILLKGMDSYTWQVKQCSMVLLEALARLHQNALATSLPELVLMIITCMQDTKITVADTAHDLFKNLCGMVVSNPDIQPILPNLLKAYSNPLNETAAMLDKLLETTFVSRVDAPTLSVIVPILKRGMNERQTLMKRKAVIILGNMCKLVDDPRDATEFYPILAPTLTKLADEVAFEEVRQVCESTLNILKKVMGDASQMIGQGPKPEEIEVIVKGAIAAQGKASEGEQHKEAVAFVVSLVLRKLETQNGDLAEWKKSLSYLVPLVLSEQESDIVTQKIKEETSRWLNTVEEKDDGSEDVLNAEFSLAYGGKILLQNAKLRLRRGHRYGLVGQNGVGKTTLLRSMASRNLEGLPDDLRVVYVQHDLEGARMDTKVVQLLSELPGVQVDQIPAVLKQVGFSDAMSNAEVGALSGGWVMRLVLAKAILLNADLYLMDEPTNHLDSTAVAWLTEYLKGLKHVTCLIVSHSSSFLDDVCTDIIHYDSLQLTRYPGNLSQFVQKCPKARVYYELASSSLVFKFPTPGRMDGVKTKGKPVLSMENVTFTYPGAKQPTLINVSIKLTLGSRVAVLGVNGAGKSTLIKLLVGEITPDSGEVWKHHNLRIAYVAQHSFHHLEQHLEDSPVQYIMDRFAHGEDKEIFAKETMQVSKEEANKIGKEFGQVESILGRRTKGKQLEYEVKFVGKREKDNKYLSRAVLEEMGYGTLIRQTDERLAAIAGGLDLRPLTTKEIQSHLDDFGLEAEFGTHGKIRGLSGGQKVRLVLASAMWNCPHLMVLDEPTNFLDREALGAFSSALKAFGGGVIMISHDTEWYSELCHEKWLVENHRLKVDGARENDDTEIEEQIRRKVVLEEEPTLVEVKDKAGGNTNSIKDKATPTDFWGKPLNKKQLRALQKSG